MSGVLGLVASAGAPIDPGLTGRMLATLDHRGPDGRDLVVHGSLAVGHQHHWTTPEELGERQPLAPPGGRIVLAFDGRLDNREELAADLHIDRGALAGVSDAALALRAFERWGEECFECLLGPFAIVIADRLANILVCARDPLGDRTLFFGGDLELMVVASEEQAVLAHPRLRRELDDASLAALFAVRARPEGHTFFRRVRELPQGHLLRIGGGRTEVRRYWRWQPRTVELRDDREYAEAFGELLTRAVQCRLRGPAPVGVLMSGGLDSTSVACLAARELGPGRRLTTVSWVFDELSSCDERPYMDAVLTSWGMTPLRVAGDDGWPLRDSHLWPYNPNRPMDNPYRILKDRAYAASQARGVPVLLTGGWGDHLYSGSGAWLVEQIAAGRWWVGARELVWHAVHGRALAESGVRRLAARLLRPRARGSGSATPTWMTGEAAALLEPRPTSYPDLDGWRRPDQAAMVAGLLAADSAAAETFHAARHGIELRHPYRDRRLVEFMLAIPADQLCRRGRLKHVLRVAMEGILPDLVRLRVRPTSLLPLYRRGMVDREANQTQELLADPFALWRPFVDADQLLRVLPQRIASAPDSAACLVPWFCSYAQLWLKMCSRVQAGDAAAA